MSTKHHENIETHQESRRFIVSDSLKTEELMLFFVTDRFINVQKSRKTFTQFKSVKQTHHLVCCVPAGISVVLDLTPNYQGSSGPWFSNISVTSVAERLKVRV